MVRFLLLIWLLSPAVISALVISADGYGSSNEEAKRSALATLSESLHIQVTSISSSATNQDGLLYAKQVQKSVSDLPLLGAKLEYIDMGAEKQCLATMSSADSLQLYQRQIDRMVTEIQKLHQEQVKQKKSADTRYHTLQQLAEKLDQIDDYITVAVLLGLQQSPKLPVTAEQIANELRSIESKAPTIAIAAKQLTANLPQGRYHVSAALPHGSREVTQLGRLLRDAVAQEVGSVVASASEASHLLQGKYEILHDSISVRYQVVTTDSEQRNGRSRSVASAAQTVASRQVTLQPSAYRSVSYKPQNPDYDSLLGDKVISTNSFLAAITTNKGNKALDFQQGDVLQVLVKLNRPGFFFITGHIRDKNHSYLLEINPIAQGESDDNRFIVSVDSSQVNRWIDITSGGYKVIPPFGVEDLQLIATTTRPKLPAYKQRDRDGYFLLQASSNAQAVSNTRGIIPKFIEESGNAKKTGKPPALIGAEDNLTFVTRIR